MKSILFLTTIVFLIFIGNISTAIAQYKAIDLSVTTSPYLDDNKDREYEYQEYSLGVVSHYILGYSFPISPNILLNARGGVSSAAARYSTNRTFSNSSGNPSFPTSVVIKNNKHLFGNVGIAGSYWFKPTYTGLFFTGELWSIIAISAKSEIYKSQLIESSTEIEYDEEFINRDIKDQMQPIVPIISVGIGYNIKIAYGVHVFANMNFDYRPTGYFKNTENITHINRRLTLGLKYVIEKATPTI